MGHITVLGAGGSNCSNSCQHMLLCLDHGLFLRRLYTAIFGDDLNHITVFAGPVFHIATFSTGSILCINMRSVGVAGRNGDLFQCGFGGQCLIRKQLITVVAVPVFIVSIFGTGSTLGSHMLHILVACRGLIGIDKAVNGQSANIHNQFTAVADLMCHCAGLCAGSFGSGDRIRQRSDVLADGNCAVTVSGNTVVPVLQMIGQSGRHLKLIGVHSGLVFKAQSKLLGSTLGLKSDLGSGIHKDTNVLISNGDDAIVIAFAVKFVHTAQLGVIDPYRGFRGAVGHAQGRPTADVAVFDLQIGRLIGRDGVTVRLNGQILQRIVGSALTDDHNAPPAAGGNGIAVLAAVQCHIRLQGNIGITQIDILQQRHGITLLGSIQCSLQGRITCTANSGNCSLGVRFDLKFTVTVFRCFRSGNNELRNIRRECAAGNKLNRRIAFAVFIGCHSIRIGRCHRAAGNRSRGICVGIITGSDDDRITGLKCAILIGIVIVGMLGSGGNYRTAGHDQFAGSHIDAGTARDGAAVNIQGAAIGMVDGDQIKGIFRIIALADDLASVNGDDTVGVIAVAGDSEAFGSDLTVIDRQFRSVTHQADTVSPAGSHGAAVHDHICIFIDVDTHTVAPDIAAVQDQGAQDIDTDITVGDQSILFLTAVGNGQRGAGSYSHGRACAASGDRITVQIKGHILADSNGFRYAGQQSYRFTRLSSIQCRLQGIIGHIANLSNHRCLIIRIRSAVNRFDLRVGRNR